MSQLRLGKRPDGTREIRELEPARARLHGFAGITLGQALTDIALVRQPKSEREVEVGK